MTKKILLASDHGGVDLKNALVEYTTELGFEAIDLGPFNTDSVDYPDYANLLADKVSDGTADSGVLVCGSGIGISIAANRHSHIRCALVTNPTEARLCREHNDANVLALGARVIGIERAKENVKIFLNTKFEGGRHQNRIDKMS